MKKPLVLAFVVAILALIAQPVAAAQIPTKEQARAHCEISVQRNAQVVVVRHRSGMGLEAIIADFMKYAAEHNVPPGFRDAFVKLIGAMHGPSQEAFMAAYEAAVVACAADLRELRA